MLRSFDSDALLLGLAVGVLVGALVGGALVSDANTIPSDSSSPPTSVTSASSCYDGPPDDDGWLHVVANGETWSVTLETTVVHPPDVRAAVEVSERPMGDYEIALTADADDREFRSADRNCTRATTVNVATALQRPEFTITVDGETIAAVAQDETVANLYSLPNPINASG